MTVVVPRPAQIPYWLGGQIDVRAEVDTGAGEGLGALWDEGLWDYNRWGSEDPDWVDFTPYVLGITIRQGAQRWGDRIETGTASITVDNTTGIFVPESGVPDPWFRVFRPGRKVRIVAIPDTTTGDKVPLFTGRLDAAFGNVADGGYDITSTLQLHDFMGDWAAYDPLETTDTGNQRTDLRVQAALDRYGWPADERDIQTGDHNVTGSTLSDTTLEECQRAADAEGGVFFCSKDGLATFKNKDWLTTDTRSTVIQGYVGYSDVSDVVDVEIPFVTSYVLAAPRSDYGDYVGMTIEVGAEPIVVTRLGRWVIAGNVQTHPVKLVVQSTGVDVAGGGVTVTTVGAPAGAFAYTDLAAPVTLAAGTKYHLVALNLAGGDQFYEAGTAVGHTTAATILGSVYKAGAYFTAAAPDTCYGPLSFEYQSVPEGLQFAHIDSDLSTSWELARVVNHAAYARAGGTAQEAEDVQSQSYYGIRSHKRTDLHNTSDGEVLALAVRMVNSSKDLRPRADEITITGVEDPDNDNLNKLLWNTELGDLLSIQASTPYGWQVEREVHVFGIDHQITGNDWTVSFRLDDAQTVEYDYWILDDPVASVLEQTTRVQ